MNKAKQEQTQGYWAQPPPGGQLLVIDTAQVPAMSLSFAAISRNLKLKMTGVASVCVKHRTWEVNLCYIILAKISRGQIEKSKWLTSIILVFPLPSSPITSLGLFLPAMFI